MTKKKSRTCVCGGVVSGFTATTPRRRRITFETSWENHIHACPLAGIRKPTKENT